MSKTVYKCSECSTTFPKWRGKCEECDSIGTLHETEADNRKTTTTGKRSLSNTIGGKQSDRASLAASGATATPVSEVIKKEETTTRISTGINEFDRVLGGGLVPGGVTILAGPPGVGKALSLTTKILTPDGMKLLKDVHPGDYVYTPSGRTTKVVAETEIFKQRPVEHLLMSSGELFVADINHEWLVYKDGPYDPVLINTEELTKLHREGVNIFIRNADPLQPLSDTVTPLATKMSHTSPNYLTGDSFTTDNPLRYSIEDRYKLLASYLYSDANLFDFDEGENVGYTVMGYDLADKLLDIAHSLGIRTEAHPVPKDKEYEIAIYPRHELWKPFTPENLLPEDHINHFSMVEEIFSGNFEDTKCIEVEDESHMFLAGLTLLPTHNSSIGLAVAAQLASTQDKKVLYITGEETDTQVAQRAIRTGAAQTGTNLGANLYLLSEQNLQNCLKQAEEMQPDFILVDSLQALLSENSESSLGSITQVTEVATAFTHLAKHTNTPTILIGQVTKENEIAGPRVVEHLVDTVLFFESNSETPLRFLRAIKNRYGSTDEIGCFEHTDRGLEEVSDPSGFFVNDHEETATGYASTIILEGVRALPLEINALTVPSNLGNPRRVTTGVEHARALTIQAVISKYLKVMLDAQDVYIATAGGLKLKDTATDLAVAAAIMSSYQEIALPYDYAFIGEVSLTGEIRSPRDVRKRISELNRLGFRKVFCPPLDEKLKRNLNSLEIVEVNTLVSFTNSLFG